MAVVYTHTRLDNNKVFYVGIGTKKRAFDRGSRNKYWYSVVNKHGYKVDITHEDVCWEEACSIEKYLIAFYGRADLKLGTLVNMTDGGDGTINKSEESKLRQLETAKINGTYDRMCERMRYYASKDKSGVNSIVRREVFLYDNNGRFVDHFITMSECANKIGSSVGNISKRIDSGMAVKGYYIFSKDKGTVLSSDQYKVTNLSERGRNNTKKTSVKLIEKKTGLIQRFETLHDASLFLGKNRKYLSQRLRSNKTDLTNYKIVFN